MNLSRLRELAGQDPLKQVAINELKAQRDELIQVYNTAIAQVQADVQLDESAIFNAVSTALKAAGQVAKKSGKVAAERSEHLSPNLKNLYMDDEVQGELKHTMDAVSRVNHVMTGLDRDAPTILQKDSEVKTVLGLLKDVLVKLIDQLADRSAVPLVTNESLVAEQPVEESSEPK